MTIQEAYNKGLDDAENLAIAKLNAALNDQDDGPFLNPEMEKIRQQILNREHKSFDKDRMLEVFESIIRGKPRMRPLKDPDIEDFRKRLHNIIMEVYKMTTKKTAFAKHMRKMFRNNTKQLLTSDEDEVN